MIDDKLVHEALRRWAGTADGRVFYVGLQKILMSVPADTSGSALRLNLGRRRFASELMAVMAEAMAETTSDDGVGSDRPIIFQLKQPVAGLKHRGARRRGGGSGPAESK